VSRGDLTPAQLNEWLLTLSKELGDALDECRQAAAAAARADTNYKRAWSHAFLQAEGPVRAREVMADAETLDEREQAKTSEARSRSADLAVRSRMAQLNALQSVSASVRQEHRWGQTGPEVT